MTMKNKNTDLNVLLIFLYFAFTGFLRYVVFNRYKTYSWSLYDRSDIIQGLDFQETYSIQTFQADGWQKTCGRKRCHRESIKVIFVSVFNLAGLIVIET